MNVLIVDFDPFANTGGGQTVYRNLIARNPHSHFSYFSRQPNARSPVANAEPLHFRQRFIARYVPTDPLDEAHYSAFLTARNFANAARGRHFDVIDVPDYYDFGAYLGPAMREFGVHFDRLVVSLHGRLSETRFINWEAHQSGLRQDYVSSDPSPEYPSARQVAVTMEASALRAADVRYAISDWYAEHLSRDLGDLPVERLSPWSVMETPPPPPREISTDARLETLFVGRLERTKGPDLFVDLAWLTSAADYGDVTILGADEHCRGRAISHQLVEQAAKRNVPLSYHLPVQREALLRRLENPCLVLAPSRFETFGLVPLEALLRGSLVGYTKHSGLASFLRAELPELLRAEFDPRDLTAAAESIEPLLANFRTYRARNVDYLNQLRLDRRALETSCEENLQAIYRAASHTDDAVRDEFEYRYNSELATRPFVSAANKSASLRQFYRSHISPGIPNWMQAARWHVGQLRGKLRGLRPRPRDSARRMVYHRLPALHALGVELRTRRSIAETPKPVDSNEVLKRLAENTRAGRMYHFQTLAMGEARRGNVLLKHLYLQRIARWTGVNRLYDCHRASHAYEQRGFEDVATVLPWLCPASHKDRDQRVYDYLMARVRQFPLRRKDSYAIRADRRVMLRPKLSVIVSLYNAQDKLDTFLTMLRRTDMMRARQVELILVDSGSPTVQISTERLKSIRTWTDVLYLRTAERETIATAWNRGLSEARGEYIACLGADEMVTPDALGKLAGYLDEHRDVDWVTANAIVMNVDTEGRFVESPLVYDRSGMTELAPLLDSTYLTYVGGMYRRRLHDLFGGYDTSFRAASDTEFKHRVFPFIRTGHINQTLGVFRDYPEARMTSHPRAEAEDLRAMYLFRTPGGLRYVLRDRDESQALDLLRMSLSFRRAYSQSYDTDLDLASNVAAYLTELNPGSKLYQRLQRDVTYLRDVARRSDSWTGSRRQFVGLTRDACRLSRLEKSHRRLLDAPVYYHLFNDVRYSVHCNVWSLAEGAF
jgi:glycosyltransferase involved in cell wall biosynthesis